MKRDPVRDMLTALQVPGATISVISFTFGCMSMAEEEIKRARLTKAQTAQLFRAVLPPMSFQDKAFDLYRAHVRELCERVRVGAKLAPGTDAECLVSILDTSLIAPLERNACTAADVLFARVFPGKLPANEAPRESWAGAVDEVIATLRKKCTSTRRDASEAQP